MKKTKFALIGCGNVAKKHVEVIQNILQGAEIAGFCDVEIDRAEKFARQFNLPAFSSAKEMMEKIGDEIDIVDVLTPSGMHHKTIMDIVEYGKTIVVEKPIALRLDEAYDIIRACNERRIKIFVVHQNRYNLPVLKARQAFEAGRFGRLVMGTVRLRWKRDQAYYDSAPWRGTRAYDGGVFMNQASHHIDMLRWFMGPVDSVKAISTKPIVDIECEDTGAALIKFTNGAIGIIEATTAARPKDLEGSISILGEKGSIVIGGFFMNELTTWEFQDKEPADDTIFGEYGKNPSAWGHNLGEYLKGVINTVDVNGAGPVDGPESIKSLELVEAIYSSIETGNEIAMRSHSKMRKPGAIS
jgi:predicted dehydrogenase